MGWAVALKPVGDKGCLIPFRTEHHAHLFSVLQILSIFMVLLSAFVIPLCLLVVQTDSLPKDPKILINILISKSIFQLFLRINSVKSSI